MRILGIIIFLLIVRVDAVVHAQVLSKNEVRQLVGQIPGLLSKHYVLPEKREYITAEIRKRIKRGDYAEVTHPDSLAKLLTKDLRTICNDKHVYLQYVAEQRKEEDQDWQAWEVQEKAQEVVQNFGFRSVEVLPGNVGYLQITEFMHPYRGMQTAVAAMKLLEHTEGLIVDLRGNGGGYEGIMKYILNHYFDGEPTHITTTVYSDKDKYPDLDYTSDLVLGKLRAGTPLYVLIDRNTGSAAEYFAYTLQAFGKAKVLGEPSAGAAHRNTYYPLSKSFRLSVATASPINPITNSNWENSGVQPDYPVPTEAVKDEALQRMIRELNARKTD